MSQNLSRSQTRLVADDGTPMVIDVETAVDEVYSALANERRRTVLCALLREGVPIDLEALTAEVVTAEFPNGVDAKLRRRIRISLYHNHLPKLAALDLIEFNADELTVDGVADTVSSAADRYV